MLIIELLGTPGCGKTSITNKVIEQLKERNIKAAGHKDALKFRLSPRSRSKFPIPLIMREYQHYYLFIAVILFCMNYILKGARVKYIRNLLILCHRMVILKKVKHYDVLLLDEGICQHLSGISHNKYLKKNYFFNKVAKAVKRAFPELVIIKCEISTDENLRRIRSRNRKDSRYDSITDDSKLLTALKIKKENLEQISERIAMHPITIDMGNDIEVNQEKIISLVVSQIK